MLETNIRIIRPGQDLYLWIRRAVVDGSDLSVELLQRACGMLRYRHGLAAIPCGSTRRSLLIASTEPIPTLQLEGEDWVLNVQDASEPSRKVSVRDAEGAAVIPDLVERAILVELARRTDLWTLDSPRKWYEPAPFQSEDGIAAYRRFEIAALLIDDVGVGVAVDVNTAFFTEAALAYFFDDRVDVPERHERHELFTKLTRRQPGQKGTLLYDNGRSRVKCYFEDAPEGVTCGTTGPVRVRGKTYTSLFAYYQAEYPGLSVTPESRAVRVSFEGLSRPQYVAADRVRVRVMNDHVPDSLSDIDKINPAERRELIERFWQRLEPRPVGSVAPGLYKGFWRPDTNRITRFPLVELQFGDEHSLPGTSSLSISEYRTHYQQRLEYVENVGCYFVPPTITRTLYCAYPRRLGEKTARQAADDMAAKISKWTRVGLVVHPIGYDTLSEAIERLRRTAPAGMVIFVLNDEPSAYYEAAFQLPDWRIKRMTERELCRHYDYLANGAWDKRQRRTSLERGGARWERFINLNALDVLQQLDCIPWRAEQCGPYEAQIAIDVGHDRRHFALSLLVARQKEKTPSIWIDSVVVPKPDHQHESINAIMLAEQIQVLFHRMRRSHVDGIRSLLIFRDGKLPGNELTGIKDKAIPDLIAAGLLAENARVDIVDFHKKTLTAVRLWEIDQRGDVHNPLEGTAVLLTPQMVVVASTGNVTLHQGTAQPFVLVGNGDCPAILDAAKAAFDAAQLNFSSPTVAQRLPLTLKRTDDELTARAAQEIRRLR